MKLAESLLFTVLILLIVSCSGKPTKHTAENQQITITDLGDSLTVTDSTSEDAFYDLGEQLIADETIGNLKIGMTFDEVKNILGKPDEISQPDSSEVDGENYKSLIYKNKGINIGLVISEDSMSNVSWIEMVDSCKLLTSKAIGLGSMAEDVTKAYSDFINPELCDSTSVLAGSFNLGMYFSIKEGRVNRLYIGAMGD
jgi:hypothetical protein